jgi:hypothetical protein
MLPKTAVSSRLLKLGAAVKESQVNAADGCSEATAG